MGSELIRVAADNGRGFMNQFVIFESRNHEQGEVDAAGEIPIQGGIADMSAPYGHALARPFFEMADSDGRDWVSTRNLAKALGGEAMSLCNHVANVANKNDLVLDGLKKFRTK